MSGKIVVTGAAGHLGYNLVKKLVSDGIKPLVILHQEGIPGHLHRLGSEIEIVQTDPYDRNKCLETLKGAEVVYHTGTSGQVHNYLNAEESIHPEDMVKTTETLMYSAAENNVDKFIYFNSVTTGNTQAHLKKMDVRSDWKNIRISYFRNKMAAEHRAGEMTEELGANTIFVNSSMIIGPDDYLLTPANRFILDLLTNRLRIMPRGGMNPVDVRDVAEGLIKIAEQGKIGHRYILAGDNNLYFREFANYLAEIREIRIPEKVLSKKVAFRLASVSEWFSGLMGKEPEISHELVEDIVERYAWFDNSLAREELGWQPRPLKETLQDTVIFLEKHYI
jgi:dihydroflavonol-4-reductase